MGQAKQRGTLEERIAQTQQDNLDGERITIEKAKSRLELPDSAEWIAMDAMRLHETTKKA